MPRQLLATLSIVVLASAVALPPPADALVLCAAQVRRTGDVRDGAPLRVRSACRPNEVAVDPGVFGGGGGVETHSFSSETVLGTGTKTLYLTTNGRLHSDEYEARTPLGGGTLRNLRCYLPDAPGGGGMQIAVGAGPCGADLAYGSSPSVSFAGGDGQVVRHSGSTTLAITAGQCVALRVELLGTTTATYVNCTLERVPG